MSYVYSCEDKNTSSKLTFSALENGNDRCDSNNSTI